MSVRQTADINATLFIQPIGSWYWGGPLWQKTDFRQHDSALRLYAPWPDNGTNTQYPCAVWAMGIGAY